MEEDRYLLYAPLQRAAMIVNGGVLRVLRQTGLSASAAGLWPIPLLRSVGIVNPGDEQLPVRIVAGAPTPVDVTLLLTTACNLQCGYCYAAAEKRQANMMALESAQRAIRFVGSNAVARGVTTVGVTFHGGGEPTMNWEVLTRSTEYARRLAEESGLRLSATLATNGVMTETQTAWVSRHLTSISISCDGVDEVQDVNRPLIRGGTSSGCVRRTLEQLSGSGFPFGIRMTVLQRQVSRLAESIDYLFTRFRPRVVQVEPVYQMGRGLHEEQAEGEEFLEEFRRARSKWGAVMFSGAKLDVLDNHFCAATADGFCISASGNVTACTEAFSEDGQLADQFFYGKPAEGPDGYEFDEEALARLRSRGVEHRAFCSGCFARWTCGGDCLYKVMDRNRAGPLAGGGRCRIIRELTKDLLLERIAQSGNGIWKGSPPAVPGETGCLTCEARVESYAGNC
jgi:uncharacterized protein